MQDFAQEKLKDFFFWVLSSWKLTAQRKSRFCKWFLKNKVMGENWFQACKLYIVVALDWGCDAFIHNKNKTAHSAAAVLGMAASCTGLASSSCQAAVWVLPSLTLAPGSTRLHFGWMGGRGAGTLAVSWVGTLKVSQSAIHVDALPRPWHAECSSELLDNYWTGISAVCSSPETVSSKGF